MPRMDDLRHKKENKLMFSLNIIYYFINPTPNLDQFLVLV